MSERLSEEEIIQVRNIISLIYTKEKKKEPPKIDPKFAPLFRVIVAVCAAHNIDYWDFASAKRIRPFVYARIDYVHLAYNYVTKNKARIARGMGKNHNAIVSYLLSKAATEKVKRLEKLLFRLNDAGKVEAI